MNVCVFPPLNPGFQITVAELSLPSEVTLIGWLGFPVEESKMCCLLHYETKNEITRKNRNIYGSLSKYRHLFLFIFWWHQIFSFPFCFYSLLVFPTLQWHIYIICSRENHREKLVLLWAQLTKIYPPLPTSVLPISITKTLLIVPTKNERDPPLFIGKLLIKFQNILRNTTQIIIRHRVTILFSVISSPITLERQNLKSSKMKGMLLSSPVSCW